MYNIILRSKIQLHQNPCCYVTSGPLLLLWQSMTIASASWHNMAYAAIVLDVYVPLLSFLVMRSLKSYRQITIKLYMMLVPAYSSITAARQQYQWTHHKLLNNIMTEQIAWFPNPWLQGLAVNYSSHLDSHIQFKSCTFVRNTKLLC